MTPSFAREIARLHNQDLLLAAEARRTGRLARRNRPLAAGLTRGRLVDPR